MHLVCQAFCTATICTSIFSKGEVQTKHTGTLRQTVPQGDTKSELQVPHCLCQRVLNTGRVKMEALTSSMDSALLLGTSVCSPILALCTISKGMMKPAAEFLVISEGVLQSPHPILLLFSWCPVPATIRKKVRLA